MPRAGAGHAGYDVPATADSTPPSLDKRHLIGARITLASSDLFRLRAVQRAWWRPLLQSLQGQDEGTTACIDRIAAEPARLCAMMTTACLALRPHYPDSPTMKIQPHLEQPVLCALAHAGKLLGVLMMDRRDLGPRIAGLSKEHRVLANRPEERQTREAWEGLQRQLTAVEDRLRDPGTDNLLTTWLGTQLPIAWVSCCLAARVLVRFGNMVRNDHPQSGIPDQLDAIARFLDAIGKGIVAAQLPLSRG